MLLNPNLSFANKIKWFMHTFLKIILKICWTKVQYFELQKQLKKYFSN